MWLYQELVHDVGPDLIIETGTWHGGSALYFAHLLDLRGAGEVVSIDVEHRVPLPSHPRITFLRASSTDPGVVAQLRERAARARTVMVILDSDHSRDHVAAELDAYADLVTPGSYLVVEDGTVNGHPVLPEFGPGPYEAQQDFLRRRGDFSIDHTGGRYLITNNPAGYLRRNPPSP